MKIQVIKSGKVNTKKQSMCDVLIDEPPMDKK